MDKKRELEKSIEQYKKWIADMEKDLENRSQKNKEWEQNSIITGDNGSITINGNMSGCIVGNNIKNATVRGSKPYSDSNIASARAAIEQFKKDMEEEQAQLDQL
jgi:Sec-independent protein translocase protein TatA